MSKQGWCISKIGWCVGHNTAHLAKLPHFPSFLSLFLVRANRFDDASDRVKLFSKSAKAQKNGVLVNSLFSSGGFLLL
jgi:hypothetical protein